MRTRRARVALSLIAKIYSLTLLGEQSYCENIQIYSIGLLFSYGSQYMHYIVFCQPLHGFNLDAQERR